MKFIEDEKETKDDIYCPVCGTCGEEGCCNPISHIEIHLNNSKNQCLYGKEMLKDIKFGYVLGNKLFDRVMVEGKITKEIAEQIYDDLWYKYSKKEN